MSMSGCKSIPSANIDDDLREKLNNPGAKSLIKLQLISCFCHWYHDVTRNWKYLYNSMSELRKLSKLNIWGKCPVRSKTPLDNNSIIEQVSDFN
jgi:hypothetical protein